MQVVFYKRAHLYRKQHLKSWCWHFIIFTIFNFLLKSELHHFEYISIEDHIFHLYMVLDKKDILINFISEVVWQGPQYIHWCISTPDIVLTLLSCHFWPHGIFRLFWSHNKGSLYLEINKYYFRKRVLLPWELTLGFESYQFLILSM
jgi:hypothetical protein